MKVLPSKVVESRKYRAETSERNVKIVLAFLKHNASNNLLAVVFKLRPEWILQILKATIKRLSLAVGQNLIFKPTSESGRKKSSKYFRNFPEVTAIIDCTEARTELPRCDGCYRRLISGYKGYTTVKFLISVAPCGLVTFVSPTYGGSTTDNEIVRTSGLLDHLQSGDVVLADRGFTLVGRFFLFFLRIKLIMSRFR